MAESCNIRFGDNQKIEQYTISNEDSTYPFTNALDTVRSRILKATDNNDWRLILDLDFPDKINFFSLFAPLGTPLGITREATIRIEADNVNDWASPEFSQVVTIDNDNQIVDFIDTDQYYRFWSIYIDDPTNPDFISFGYIYLGDYTFPRFRGINRGFSWNHNDVTGVTKSLNGTPYFDERIRFDTWGPISLAFVTNSDRSLLEEMYQRVGVFSPMPISIDPDLKTTSDLNKLTRYARFADALSMEHQVFEYYGMSFSLEEVI